jgi:hypothetical protein
VEQTKTWIIKKYPFEKQFENGKSLCYWMRMLSAIIKYFKKIAKR